MSTRPADSLDKRHQKIRIPYINKLIDAIIFIYTDIFIETCKNSEILTVIHHKSEISD